MAAIYLLVALCALVVAGLWALTLRLPWGPAAVAIVLLVAVRLGGAPPPGPAAPKKGRRSDRGGGQ